MRSYLLGASVIAFASVFACSSTSGTSGFGSDGGSGSGGSGGSGSGGSGSGSSGGSGSGSIGGTINGSGSGGTSGDGGFVCAPNPANYDIPGNNCDDDDDGKVDNVTVCDNGTMPPANLSSAGTAADMMAALGLCQVADSTHWGVVSATYTNGHTQSGAGPSNFSQQHGTLATFGSVIKPREGSLLGALSSGSATATDSDTGPQFKGGKNGMQGGFGGAGDVPSGFPAASKGCPTLLAEVYDVIDVKVQLKVPANAKGFSFDFDFWSGEWPDYVCSTYNDSFIAYLTSAAFQSGTAGNISFDTNGNPLSVDNNFFQSCTAGAQTGCQGSTTATATCSLGTSELAGTGFDDPLQAYCGSTQSTSGGATSWLTSTAPAKPGETLSIEFIIWDTGDWNYDSSVLLDNWVWQPQVVPATPVTQPSPPK
jgi:hypothetical protein